MALKEYLLLTILISASTGISSALTWNRNVRRYGSYDLERGPVFYEAYYPDSNEEARSNYQEKRYFDRGAVLERSYQVPSDRIVYPESSFRVGDYHNPAGKLRLASEYVDPRQSVPESNSQVERTSNFLPERGYNARNDYPALQTGGSIPEDGRAEGFSTIREGSQSLGMKEISSIARRAISRDLENWNMIENYLDRANHQDQGSSYRQQLGEPGPPRYNSLDRPLQETNNGAMVQDHAHSLVNQRNLDGVRGLNNRDLASRDPFRKFESGDTREREWQTEPRSHESEMRSEPFLRQENMRGAQKEVIPDPYLPENIFAPRPQVINYVFSKKPARTADNKIQDVPATKQAPKDSVPRNYGDNLIREEIKKAEEPKDVKVTSIEISEVPRHKTRHHHGEWPKRDYSHHHQS